MPRGQQSSERVLVLGATSAIASAVCILLAPAGTHFFLVARDAGKLDAVRSDLLTRGASQVEIAIADLNDTAQHEGLLADAVLRLGGIDLAFIAYGILGDQEQAQASFTDAELILRTNFLSAASLIIWLANYFEAQRTGVLAVVSSVAGDRGRKSNYIYGASKGALNIFLDGVRNRIDRAGVHVLTIRPGFVATPMTSHLPRGPLFATPERVATGILSAIRQRKDIAYVPGFWAVITFVIRSIPESIFKRLNL